jgi:hypothetical protein
MAAKAAIQKSVRTREVEDVAHAGKRECAPDPYQLSPKT